MPTFPPPPPDIPSVLNPLDPRHYWLLFKWLFFQPSHLRHYLYRADPELYKAKVLRVLRRVLRLPACRSLLGMSIPLIIPLSILVAWITSLAQGTPLDRAGLALGVAMGVATGVVFSVAVGVAVGMAAGVVFSVVGGVALGVAGGVALGVAAFLGGSRGIFHLFEWPQGKWVSRTLETPFQSLRRHPVLWDELAIWTLPGAQRLLRCALESDLPGAAPLAAHIAANPFQRWAAQHALVEFLSSHPNPLAAVYELAHLPELDVYLSPPIENRQFHDWPSTRQVLFGELGQLFVDSTGGEHETSERLVWLLTRRLRNMRPSPISQFSAMLYVLFREAETLEEQPIQEIHLAERFAAAYQSVRDLPHGEEIAGSFNAIDSFLRTTTIDDLGAQHIQLEWLLSPDEPILRPPVIESLKALGDVSREVSSFRRATNPNLQAAALNRAAGALEELSGYIHENVLPPEKVLLQRVVEAWRSIVAREQGRLGAVALRQMSSTARRSAGIPERISAVWEHPLTPFDNPYVVGDPVYPPLFVGREDILNRISEIWASKKNPDSIILYGHRRMGKSSILRNLGMVAPAGSVIAYVDMAGETSFVAYTVDLLLSLADRIHAAVQRVYPEADLLEPDPKAYKTPSSAQVQFNRLLEKIRDALGGRTLILALDEFEAIERAVKGGKIGPGIYQFLRAKTQEPWITVVFGGLHTLDEMSRDYQQPFYGSYTNLCISYLPPEAAWRLITHPTPIFGLNYDPPAVERIIAETGGQPYLIQQVCRDALDHLNHELFDLGLNRPGRLVMADVEAVLEEDFFKRGTVYFDGVWAQVQHPAAQEMLSLMARHDEPWTLSELRSGTLFDSETLSTHLHWAERHDILYQTREDPPRWAFHVPLMRRWIRANV